MELDVLSDEVKSCTKCPLRGNCNQVVSGRGTHSPLFIVGEYTDGEDDLFGEPFSGRAGQFFIKLMDKAGIKTDEVYMTNMVKCKSPKPGADNINTCKGWLWKELQAIQPKVVITLGQTISSLLLRNKSPLKTIAGVPTPVSYITATIFPWYSHTYLLGKGKAWDDKTINFLRSAYEHQNLSKEASTHLD